MAEQVLHLTFSESKPQRLDKALAIYLPQLSRARWQGLIKDGFVRVNGKAVQKSGELLQAGDEIEARIPPPEPTRLEPEPIPLDILFEDEHLMVINKPAGMVVHPAAGHAYGTLVHAAIAHAPQMQGVGGEVRPGVVHRLDKDTSGIILLAKDDRSHHWLQEQFRSRQAHKVYYALVDGKPPTPRGRIEAPIGRSSEQRKQMAVVSEGKGRAAVTEYSTIESFPQHTLLEVHPVTGRTHQIRLHLKFIGCPVAGDVVYGRRVSTIPLKRQFLHAARLTICLPGEKQPKTFEAPLPPDLTSVINHLRMIGG